MCGYVPLAAAGTLTRLQDVATILGLIGVAFAAAWTTRLVDEVRPVEVLVNAAACLVLPAFSRLAYLLLAPAGLDAGTTLAMGWMAYSVAAGALALKLRWNGTAALAGGVALLAAAAYGLQIAKKVPPFGIELPLVLALLGTLGFAAFTLGRCGSLGESVSGMFTTAAFIVLPVFTRLAWLCLTHWGVSTVGALVFGWVAYSLAASAVARVNGWTEPVWIAWSCVALTWVAYGSQFVDQGFARSEELWLLTFMLASILAATLAGSRRAEDPASVVAVAVLACWALFTRLVVVGLADPTFGMRVSAAVTLAWSAYALILMSWGFARRFRLLRYWSLAVFGCTLVKVVLVDMAALDAALRVGVLMVLGVAMLGVGYWYVRNKGLLNADGGPKASA
jgi:hypothetical protein